MIILTWILFEMVLLFSINIMVLILESDSYIERSIHVYLVIAMVHLIFIFLCKTKILIKKKTKAQNYLAYILMGIGMCLFHRILFLLFPQIALSTYESMGNDLYLEIQYSFRNPFIFIYISIIAPILEELFYRGKLLNESLKKWKPVICVVLTSVLFGISHMNLVQFVNAFCLGLLCGFVYVTSEDIKAPIIIHLSNNLYSGISSLQIESFETPARSMSSMLSSIIIGLILLSLGIVIFIKENKVKSNIP